MEKVEKIELTQDEEFALFGAIEARIKQIEGYIETRMNLIECGAADPNDTFIEAAEIEIKTLHGISEKMGF